MIELAKAIYLEALFTECAFHDWLIQYGDADGFNIECYSVARRSFAERN